MNLNWLVDLLFPKFCLSCFRFGFYVCPACEQTINFYEPQTCPYCEQPSPYGFTHPRCQKRFGLDGMFVLSHYDGLVREIIRRTKYQGQFALLEDTVRLVAARYHYQYNFEFLMPVPLARRREGERGFNQAEKLANQLNKELGIPSASLPSARARGEGRAGRNYEESVAKLLIRTRETRPQFDLPARERKKNVAGAFALSSSMNNKLVSTMNRSCCLVDDVATTGATIFECAKVLKRAGAKKVWAICLARGG